MTGFTFVWTDKKRGKIFYGCRWGAVEDADRSGYVAYNECLTIIYKRRPHTFERKILGVYQTRPEMYQALQELLDDIPDRLLRTRYYNKSKKITPPWRFWSDEAKAKVKAKISATQRKNLQYEDIRERYRSEVWPKAGRKRKKPVDNVGRPIS